MIMMMLLVMMKLTQLIITMTRIKTMMPMTIIAMTMMKAMTIIAIASSHWNVLAAGPKS